MVGQRPGEDRIRALHAEHYEAVASYCARRLPIHDANEAVSETFLIAWKKLDQLQHQDNARAWLFGVARNVIRHSRRGHARRTRLNTKLAAYPPQGEPTPEVVVVNAHGNSEATQALASLKPDDQEILRLRAWDDLTAPQIAQVLDISVSAAEKRLRRAIDRLGTAVERRRATTGKGGSE